ncbi:AsmA family protein [Piscinibacter sp. XHJ-5]|uniref:AsmA family protein n=1 Tax=Piscinibacter sp. XHJ-5 TaxID=3037797 RepID=UPI0024533AE8|nr:AsmA family protein [Piscinibacter sp. XHJ-5]
MPVWIRRTLFVLLGLLVLFAAVATWLVTSFDANRFKGTAIDWMRKERQRVLVIDGPIQLSVFPRIAVKLSKVSLSEARRTDPFAALDEAGLAVDLWPLLRGEVVVDRIIAKGVRVTYLRDAQGRSNIDDLIKPQEKKPDTPEAGGGKPPRFDISGVDLADVRARVKDDMAKVDGELWLKSLTAGRLADNTSTPLKLAAQFDFKQPALKGELSGESKLALATATGSAALRDMDLRFKGDVPGASAVDAAFKGNVAWDGAKKAIDAEALKVQLSAVAAGLKLDGSTVEIDRFAYDPARKALKLRKLQARIKGAQAGQPLALDLDWPELAVDGDKLGGSPFSGKLTRGGELPLDVTFKSSAPTGGFDAVRLPGFEARIAGNAPQRKIGGTLRSDLTLKPGEPALVLDKLDLQARIEEAKLPPYAVSLQGSAVGSAKRSSWNLTGQLNQNGFATDGSATLGGATPQLTAKARFDSLDLNRLLGPGEAAAKPTTAPAGADTPVDLGALRSVDGQFSVRAASFAYKQYRVNDAAIDATMQGGMLRVTQLHGRAWGGQLDATALADARANRVAMKGSASGVNVNALVKDVAAKDLIEGTGRVVFDLDSAGRSVNELKSHLKGSAALQVRDGAVKGINLAKSLRQAKAALTMKQDAAQKASQTEKTDFSELTASFQIADGVARSRDLDMKSPFLRLGGEGAIDVGRGRIDYLTKATVTSTSKGQDGAELESLKGLTIPVRLAGPFESLDWKIEWSSVAAAAVTQQLEKKLGEKLGEKLGMKAPGGAASAPSPKDDLKNKLKGLFK